ARHNCHYVRRLCRADSSLSANYRGPAQTLRLVFRSRDSHEELHCRWLQHVAANACALRIAAVGDLACIECGCRLAAGRFCAHVATEEEGGDRGARFSMDVFA